jgi:hypothetical protein
MPEAVQAYVNALVVGYGLLGQVTLHFLPASEEI